MMRPRSMFVTVSLASSALLIAVMPAGASVSAPTGPGSLPPASLSQVRLTRGVPGWNTGGADVGIAPAGRILDDVLNGDSCTTVPDNPSITSACVAVGSFADAPNVDGLLQSSINGQWSGNIFGSIATVTIPIEASCVPQPTDIPTCVAVGEHFTNFKFPAQLVATGSANGFSPVAFSNPKGATWSVLDDVSCASTTFCLLVGSAGTTRRTASGLRYLSHATAYRWNGGLHALTVPAPAHATGSELGGVSCASATSCMAVGDYRNAAGRSLPYSALLTNGTWHIHVARTIGGKAVTLFQAVSCAAPGACIAVGDAVKPGSVAFAERYASGTWTTMRIASEPTSAFFSVSCPTTSACVAAGRHGTRSLIEAWNGTKWAAQTVPATAAPLTTDALLHVSCVTPSVCTAVGYRHNPAVRSSFRTLAVGWNGSSWTIQKTLNQ